MFRTSCMTKKTISRRFSRTPTAALGASGEVSEAYQKLSILPSILGCIYKLAFTRPSKVPKGPQAFPKHLPGTVVDRFFVNLLRRLSHALFHGCIAFFGMTLSLFHASSQDLLPTQGKLASHLRDDRCRHVRKEDHSKI